MQTVLNIVDHGMSLQEVVEAPRVFSWGRGRIERGFPETVRSSWPHDGPRVVAGRSCRRRHVRHRFRAPTATMTGAACWRADGVPLGMGGGLARKGTHFFTDPRGIAARAAAEKA